MRVLQLIDSLDGGGAERMAVNLFNALNRTEVVTSFLVSTRREGILKDEIENKYNYLFLERKHTFDILAIKRLIKFIRSRQITHVHAHASSYFIGSLLKMVLPGLVLIWHDHYGNSEFLNNRNYKILKRCSQKFDGIIAVNEKLLRWNLEFLKCQKCITLNNFVNLKEANKNNIILKGTQKIKVICVANLRPQKNHLFLIESFKKLDPENYSLHLFGKNFHDEYSKNVLKSLERRSNIFYYGSVSISKTLLRQATIGVLVSSSEGLPLILLEYAAAKLPVICTPVGECEKIVGDSGILIEVDDELALVNALENYADDSTLRQQNATKFCDRVNYQFGFENVVNRTIDFYNQCS